MAEFPSPQQLKALEKLVNQAIRFDPLAKQRLARLEGKSIRIECTEPKLDLIIDIGQSAIALEEVDGMEVSCHLTGELSDFVELLSASDKAAALINSDLSLRGNSQVLLDLQEILAHIELDWEYHLAKLFGDLPAHMLGKISRDTVHWLRQTQPVFMRHLQEFIVEEARLIPSRFELEDFYNEVHDVSQKTEKLEARLKVLQNRLNNKQQASS